MLAPKGVPKFYKNSKWAWRSIKPKMKRVPGRKGDADTFKTEGNKE